MIATNLHHETCATLKEWRADLGSMTATRLYANRPDLRQSYGKTAHARFRQTVETLLAHLELAILRDRPGLFADYVSDGDALPADISLNAADLGTTLEQMRDTLRQHLPGPRGELAHEYVEFALARHTGHSRSDQPQRNAA